MSVFTHSPIWYLMIMCKTHSDFILSKNKWTFIHFLVCVCLRLCFVFSYVVLTTSGGIMDHEEARRKHLGGKILGFFF